MFGTEFKKIENCCTESSEEKVCQRLESHSEVVCQVQRNLVKSQLEKSLREYSYYPLMAAVPGCGCSGERKPHFHQFPRRWRTWNCTASLFPNLLAYRSSKTRTSMQMCTSVCQRNSRKAIGEERESQECVFESSCLCATIWICVPVYSEPRLILAWACTAFFFSSCTCGP